MAVDDAFGQVGRAARVAHRGCRRLLERGPGIPGALGVQQLLVVDRARQAAAIAVAEHNQVLYCRQLADDRRQDWREARIDEQHGVLRVVDDVADLLVGKADVDGVQHRAHARHGEVRLLVLLGVPGEGRHPVALANAEVPQAGRQLLGPLRERGEADPARAAGVGGDHGAVGVVGPSMLEDVADGEREVRHSAAHLPKSPRPVLTARPSTDRAGRA